MVPLPYRVGWRRLDLADTVTLGLEPVDEAIPLPSAGQFDMLWEPGVGEVPISLSGLPDEPQHGMLEHTIRAVGPVTSALWAKEVGDVVGVRGPFGYGWDLRQAHHRDLLVVAGGLGLAPIRPVVSHALAQRDRFGRVVLLVGARDPGSLLYADQLERWRGRFDVDVEVTVDTATPPGRGDATTPPWHGDVGMVTRLLDRAPVTPADTIAVVCGPEVMMRVVADSLLDRGVSADRIWLSLERNMRCAVGHCGHCQLGPLFVCKEGPVVPWSAARPLVMARER